VSRVVRRLAVCLAFSTCCFLASWVALGTGPNVYFARWGPLYTIVIPVLLLEGVLTLGLFGVWELFRYWGWHRAIAAHLLFLAACTAPLGLALAGSLQALPSVFSWLRNPLSWLVGLPLVFWASRGVIRKPRTASRFVRNAFLTASPVLAVVTISGAWATLRYSGSPYTDGPLAPALPGSAQIRVVWVVFDELSQAIAFEQRPSNLRLPNLDRLKAESFYAVAASSPADATLVSMPALILGQDLAEAKPLGPDELLLRRPGLSPAFPWASVPNIFDTARALGLNTALAGWYHPYGRLLNHSLTQCYWVAMLRPFGLEEPFDTGPRSDTTPERWWSQIADLPMIRYLRPKSPETLRRRERIERFLWLLQHARELVADPSIGLVLLHLPVPHTPAIYSRSKGALAAEGPLSYLDNVALADQTLGVLRQAIEQAGLWDRTALLVSSDHGWRTRMWRGAADWTAEEEAASHVDTSDVPFLLRLPGQTSGLRYDNPFNTVITRQILNRILSGQLKAPEEMPHLIQGLAAEVRK
jgi:hypothetical protein